MLLGILCGTSYDRLCVKSLFYSIILMLSSLNYGFSMAYSLPGTDCLKQDYKMRHPGLKDQPVALDYFSTGFLASAIIGPVITCLALRFVGRRILTFILALLSTLFWLIFVAVQFHPFQLAITLRCILGVIVGAGSCLNPLYMVGLSQESTGFFGSLNQIGISAGFVFCYTCSPALGCQGLAGLAAGINFLLVLLVWLIPESPGISEEKPGILDIKNDLLSANWLFWLFVCVMVMVFQQMSGINMIIMNLTSLFTRQTADTDIDENVASALASVAQVLSGILGSFLIDRWGRRIIWVVSLALITLTDFAYAIFSRFTDPGSSLIWPSLVIIFLFLFGYGLGVGPIPWFLVPEIFPKTLVAVPMAVVSCVNWILAFVVVVVRGHVMKGGTRQLPWPALVAFGATSFVGTIFGFFFAKNSKPPREELYPDVWDELGTR
jgi:MFS family permease